MFARSFIESKGINRKENNVLALIMAEFRANAMVKNRKGNETNTHIDCENYAIRKTRERKRERRKRDGGGGESYLKRSIDLHLNFNWFRVYIN